LSARGLYSFLPGMVFSRLVFVLSFPLSTAV
jgi:hypothetical protein